MEVELWCPPNSSRTTGSDSQPSAELMIICLPWSSLEHSTPKHRGHLATVSELRVLGEKNFSVIEHILNSIFGAERQYLPIIKMSWTLRSVLEPDIQQSIHVIPSALSKWKMTADLELLQLKQTQRESLDQMCWSACLRTALRLGLCLEYSRQMNGDRLVDNTRRELGSGITQAQECWATLTGQMD